MPQELLLQVAPEVAADPKLLQEHVGKLIQVSAVELQNLVILKRSIDARQKAIKSQFEGVDLLSRRKVYTTKN